jgi:uncharacterized protein YyaL (SSP411 family)
MKTSGFGALVLLMVLLCVEPAECATLKEVVSNSVSARTQLSLYAASGDDRYFREGLLFARTAQQKMAVPPDVRILSPADLGELLKASSELSITFLDLYSVSGDRSYLPLAEEHATRVVDYASLSSLSEMYSPTFVRALNRLFRYTVHTAYYDFAQKLLATQAQVSSREEQTISSLGAELGSEPLHITVVGHKDDAAALALFRAALKYPETYKLTDWWDKREGPLPNPEIQYPELPKAAAFICANERCSLPVFSAEKIPEAIKILLSGKEQ